VEPVWLRTAMEGLERAAFWNVTMGFVGRIPSHVSIRTKRLRTRLIRTRLIRS